MNTITALGCGAFGVVLATSLVSITTAQVSPSTSQYRYLTLSYIKADAGKADEYVKYESRYSKAMHDQQVKKGRSTYWKLYAVQFGGGDDREYDYVTAMECAKFSDLETSVMDPDLQDTLGDATAAGAMKVRLPRKVVRQDLLAILESTENWSVAKSGYLRVRFMKPHEGKSAELTKQEREIWKPYFEDSVRAGRNTGWAFAAVRFPAAGDYPYTRIWFSGMDKLSDMEAKLPPELAQKWQPKFQALPMARELRKVVRDELWRLVDQTGEVR